MTDSPSDLPVVVVGAGISGIACARELAAAGVAVQVRDRGRRAGGRMAVKTVAGRPVDIGAAYFTVHDDDFAAVVEDWRARGLARPWTDTFHVGDPEQGLTAPKLGPVRWAAPGGLRSLVEDLARGLDVRQVAEVTEVGPGPVVDGAPARAVVLAMPGPQAGDLLSEALVEERAAAAAIDWEPSLSLYAGWDGRRWPEVDGVFVHDSAVLSFVADDGRRRGDGAPVLVAHSTRVLAAAHLDDPSRAEGAMLRELGAVLGITEPPRWVTVKRWSLSRPAQAREHPFHLGEELVGLCGDGWHAPSRIEAAFLSGRALGRELAARLS